MALYLGSSEKLKINLNGVVYCLNLLTKTSPSNRIVLLSSDNCILMDSNGLYLVPKIKNTLLSLDNYVLTDINSTHLTYRKDE